jgi:predicted nucleic acid-binding protein
MILVDTSVWIDHLRVSDPHLSTLLTKRLVRVHPWVVGELACGNLGNRAGVIGNLQRLPQLTLAREHEVLYLI